jgi:hypothetical protein
MEEPLLSKVIRKLIGTRFCCQYFRVLLITSSLNCTHMNAVETDIFHILGKGLHLNQSPRRFRRLFPYKLNLYVESVETKGRIREVSLSNIGYETGYNIGYEIRYNIGHETQYNTG